VVLGHLPRVVAIVSTISPFRSVMCETQFLLLLLLQSTLLIVAWCNLVGVAFGDDDTKVFDRRICCDGGHRQTSFITGAMALM
jgi:hypothetical protein